MKYLIFCDMDGSILNSDGQLSEYSVSTIKQITKKHIFCLITSNSIKKTLPYYNQLGLDTYMICKNGGSIINPISSESIMYKLSSEEILKYFTDLKPLISSAFYKCDENAYVYNFIDRYQFIMKIPDDFIVHDGDFNKFNLNASTNLYIIVEPRNVIPLLSYFNNIDVRVNCLGQDKKRAIFVISHPRVSKKEGFKYVKEKYEFDKIIGFGDSDYDINFLKKCDIPFMMKNSSVKTHEFNLTEFTNDEDGVAKELEKIECIF
ncbi:MAG: HAD-IIB family hydrolase [bacterium]